MHSPKYRSILLCLLRHKLSKYLWQLQYLILYVFRITAKQILLIMLEVLNMLSSYSASLCNQLQCQKIICGINAGSGETVSGLADPDLD